MLFKHFQIIILAAVFLLQYFFEHIYPQNKTLNNWKNERYNILLGLLNVLLIFIPASGFVWLLQFIDQKNIGWLQLVILPYWFKILLTIIVLDLWMYAWHRLNHEMPFLWKFHHLHHTDEKMNSTTAIRFHILELLFSYPGKAIVCVIAGLQYTPVLLYEILFFTAVVIHHSNIYISPATDKIYRMLFSSPGMHRIHHSINISERNSNYGSVLSVWDKLFRTSVYKDFNFITFGVKEKN